MNIKEIKEVFDKGLAEVSETLSKGVEEKTAELQKQISALNAQLSEKEVADANRLSGISQEAKTVFGAYAKTILGKSVSTELSEKVAEFRDAIEKDVILGTDASGQDLIHTQLHKGILALAETYGVFVRDAKSLTATEGLYKMVFESVPGDNGGWIAEGANISQDKITFGQRSVEMKTWRKMIGVSEQMLKNSAPADLGEYLVATLAKKFGLFIEQVGFDAVIASTGVVSVQMTDASAGSVGTTLSYDDLVNIQSACPTAVAGRAKWYSSPSVLGAVKMVKDDNGSPIFAMGNTNYIDGNAVVDGTRSIGSVLNAPYEVSDALPALADLTTLGDIAILYGDLNEAFAVITRANFRVESNNGGKYFEAGIVAVRGTTDANVAEVLPGAMVKGLIS